MFSLTRISYFFLWTMNKTKTEIFNTDKIQVTVRTVSQNVWSNRSQFKETISGFTEIQDINERRMMQVDVYSRNNDARERFWEVAMALKSTYAQQQMDLYNFKIGTMTVAIPSWTTAYGSRFIFLPKQKTSMCARHCP